MFLVVLLAMSTFSAALPQRSASPEWTVIKGRDNQRDLTPVALGKNITSLKAECEANKWCNGFSSNFGTLKYSVDGLAYQANTDVYVRVPSRPQPPTTPVYLWPRPTRHNAGESTVALAESFAFTATGYNSSLLTHVFERFTAILKTPTIATAAGPLITGCDVHVYTDDLSLNINTDEAYNLTVPSGGSCIIQAATVFGAMRGLETFSQLWNSAARSFTGAPLTVVDAPRYHHRGLMQDTARHFMPVKLLLDHLEAMSAAKLNVFHWHLTDTQSWPLELQSLPLATKAAYDKSATYSAADIATVVDAARLRGIRVIPELDMPAAHFSSILTGYPAFGAGETAAGTMSQNLDPTNEGMWSAMEGMFAELATLFPDEEIHVGFDEVDLSEWNTSAITRWMKRKSLTELRDVESYFLTRVNTIARINGKHLIIWDDPVGEGVKVGVDIKLHVWNAGMALVSKLAKQGYKIVYSNPYYLLGNSWQKMYQNQDLDNQLGGVLGGEAAMWGEQVDETNVIAAVWPQAAALAEVLWSTGYDDYPRIPGLNEARLAYWRCNVRARGLAAGPIAPGWCPLAPH